ncbi:MAG: hypothetical protein QOE76_3103 [Frankiales bacterium]|nr:hypothetical protein [Frankiales bacterium]
MPEPLPRTGRERLDAGRLSAWASAWLAGAVSYDDAVSSVIRDRVHHVSGLPGHPDQVPLGWALTELRTNGVLAVRLALPVPGDLVGLPGPDWLRRAALDVGTAAVAVAGPDAVGLALVPRREEHGNESEGRTVTVAWTALVAEPLGLDGYLPLREADQDLTEALRESTESLLSLDVARWRPELTEALTDLRRTSRSGRDEGSWLPPGYPARARLLLSRAAQLGRVVELATADDPGGSLTAAEVNGRRAALASLERAVRRARLSAYNCFGVEPD